MQVQSQHIVPREVEVSGHAHMPDTIFSKVCFRLFPLRRMSQCRLQRVILCLRVDAFSVKLVVEWRDGQDVSLEVEEITSARERIIRFCCHSRRCQSLPIPC